MEFTALFNQRRRRERRSHTQLYNVISQEIHLSSATLASFYRHQKTPRTTSLDKIQEWEGGGILVVAVVVAVIIAIMVAISGAKE